MICYSTPLILNNISWWIIQSSNKVMVEYLIGATALGIYTVAAKIPALINVIITIFSQAWGISSITEYENSNDMLFYSKVFRFYIVIVCATCIIYISFTKIFMNYYVGVTFYSAWQYVPLLLVSAVFSSISSFYGSLYGALKKSVNNMISTAISAAVSIMISVLLIPILGIWGAVLSTVVAYIVIAIYRLIDVGRFMNITIHWSVFVINCIIVILQAVLVSFDIAGYIVSIIASIAFVVNNRVTLNELIRTLSAKF